jgi:hypothetical protein
MYITPLTPLQGEPAPAEDASSRLRADKIITRHLNRSYGGPGSGRSFFHQLRRSDCGDVERPRPAFLKYEVRDEIEEATIGAGPQRRQNVLKLVAGGKWA